MTNTSHATCPVLLIEDYPVVIIEDRYSGIYSGGRWAAVAQGSTPGRLELYWLGAHGSDTDAQLFWVAAKPEWASAGNTPDLALRALMRRGLDAPEAALAAGGPVPNEPTSEGTAEQKAYNAVWGGDAEGMPFAEYIKRLEAQVAALTERARSAERECAALRADVGFEESILRIHRATSGTDA